MAHRQSVRPSFHTTARSRQSIMPQPPRPLPLQEVPDVEESEEDFWNDPNLLNNPEKLRRMKWTEEDLQLASSVDVEAVCLFTELEDFVIEDLTKMMEVFEKHEEITSAKEEHVISAMKSWGEKIVKETNTCCEIITEFKMKPFWCNNRKKKVFDKSQRRKVQRWNAAVEKFKSVFQKSKFFCLPRDSLSPDNSISEEKYMDEEDAEALLTELTTIHHELSAASKLIDKL